jgi:hypothetical protein
MEPGREEDLVLGRIEEGDASVCLASWPARLVARSPGEMIDEEPEITTRRCIGSRQ